MRNNACSNPHCLITNDNLVLSFCEMPSDFRSVTFQINARKQVTSAPYLDKVQLPLITLKYGIKTQLFCSLDCETIE